MSNEVYTELYKQLTLSLQQLSNEKYNDLSCDLTVLFKFKESPK